MEAGDAVYLRWFSPSITIVHKGRILVDFCAMGKTQLLQTIWRKVFESDAVLGSGLQLRKLSGERVDDDIKCAPGIVLQMLAVVPE